MSRRNQGNLPSLFPSVTQTFKPLTNDCVLTNRLPGRFNQVFPSSGGAILGDMPEPILVGTGILARSYDIAGAGIGEFRFVVIEVTGTGFDLDAIGFINAPAQAVDCNTNGIPDDCEDDTDGDGMVDGCDPCPLDPDMVGDGVDCGEVAFDWAPVGNPENASDPLADTMPWSGTVANEYEIAKHEVTNAQYTLFLNAVADTDTNGLYNTSMGSEVQGGITRSGTPGSYNYSLKPDMGNKPVNYVSALDAMRFVNWLDNHQPVGTQNWSTTEDGVYTVGDGSTETRSAAARFFLPTADEWYKAALRVMSQTRSVLRSPAETLSYGNIYSLGTRIKKRMLRILSMTCTLLVAN